MKPIELEIWEPDPNKPGRSRYAGSAVAEDVFNELKKRLEEQGLLPDEYFIMDTEWGNGRRLPRDADVFCITDYGESEGIYVGVYLRWYDFEGKRNTQNFATGKTLGDTSYDLDRMFLISSAITKAFHGEGYNFDKRPLGSVIDISPEEKNALTELIVKQTPTSELKSLAAKLGVDSEQHKTPRAELPELCYSTIETTGELISIRRGESGYHPSVTNTSSRQRNEELANYYNERLGVTPEQRLAMEVGSMFGWDVPGADPQHYHSATAGEHKLNADRRKTEHKKRNNGAR